jgi:hypothetical protein
MHEYKDAWAVKELLGHKTILSTEGYIHIEAQIYLQTNAGWICKTAKTIEEAKTLVECGYEYITEIDGIKLFRKRK